MKGLGGSGRYVRRICIDTVRGNNVHRNEIVLLGSRTGGGGGGGGGERKSEGSSNAGANSEDRGCRGPPPEQQKC